MTSCVEPCGAGSETQAAARRAATLTRHMVAVPATPPPFVARVERVTRRGSAVFVASRLPGRARAAPARAPALHRLRRQSAHRAADRERARRPATSSPSSGRSTRARFPIRQMRPIDVYPRQRLALDRGRQHVVVQLPLRRRARAEALVDARVRRGDRHQHRREPVHPERPRHRRRTRRRTQTARTCGPGWRSRAACSCARSRASAGAGAAAGPARRTTSTSRRTAR